MSEQKIAGPCAYCGGPTQGNYSIHRDGYGEGPEVPLCDEHGSKEEPTCEEIWARIAARRGPCLGCSDGAHDILRPCAACGRSVAEKANLRAERGGRDRAVDAVVFGGADAR